MPKVLFLPLLQIPSGHHRVADTLASALNKRSDQYQCKKIEFLSYVSQDMEKMISRTYLQWIKLAPSLYEKVYRKLAHPQQSVQKLDRFYGFLFQKKMETLIYQERPDYVVCTHAFPSYLLNGLKRSKRLSLPVINVYTDYFVNRLWGRSHINYHFAPTKTVKNELIFNDGVPAQRVFVTGIPVDETFEPALPARLSRRKRPPYHILIAGGNGGHGNIQPLLYHLNHKLFKITVLCGQNKKLYQEVKNKAPNHCRVLTYVRSPKVMNQLYDEADGLITKPGGVTISEALMKRVPIFIHSALPGQEVINQQFLEKERLGWVLRPHERYDEQLLRVLENCKEKTMWEKKVDAYCKEREYEPHELLPFVLGKRL